MQVPALWGQTKGTASPAKDCSSLLLMMFFRFFFPLMPHRQNCRRLCFQIFLYKHGCLSALPCLSLVVPAVSGRILVVILRAVLRRVLGIVLGRILRIVSGIVLRTILRFISAAVAAGIVVHIVVIVLCHFLSLLNIVRLFRHSIGYGNSMEQFF